MTCGSGSLKAVLWMVEMNAEEVTELNIIDAKENLSRGN